MFDSRHQYLSSSMSFQVSVRYYNLIGLITVHDISKISTCCCDSEEIENISLQLLQAISSSSGSFLFFAVYPIWPFYEVGCKAGEFETSCLCIVNCKHHFTKSSYYSPLMPFKWMTLYLISTEVVQKDISFHMIIRCLHTFTSHLTVLKAIGRRSRSWSKKIKIWVEELMRQFATVNCTLFIQVFYVHTFKGFLMMFYRLRS